ncbi:MAG: ATP-binding protein [Candidatus Eremiobacteraeota bacterium]|nr:ATP-binding protein [Candidatus Eremiobacteraeota bacterium]
MLIGIGIGAVGGFALRGRRSAAPTISAEPGLVDPPESANERFDRLVRALPLGVLMLERSSRVSFANRGAAAIFGFDAPRALGAHLIELIPSITLERRVDDALEGEASVGPLIVTAKNGNRTYAVSVYPLTDEQDSITGALILAEDQTELLAMERARQEFLTNVSHELRTPLASVKLMLETVLESPDDDAPDIFLPQALTQIDRLARLVQRLLLQARAESGALRLEPAPIDLRKVAAPIVQTFSQQAAAKGVTLELQSALTVQAQGDSDRLAQVFVNLIDNALRFTPAGGAVKIELDSERTQAVVRIRDTGIGIPFRDMPHIFERFYVVDRSRARELGGGAGLGLSIVKQIVEAHGGEIHAESSLGRGAVFTFTLPLVGAS